jgi:carbonic anhydrase
MGSQQSKESGAIESAMHTRPLILAIVTSLIIVFAVLPGRCDSASPGPSPEHALQQLLDGNARYVSHNPTHPDSLPSDAPQHPVAVILSCSDSRVPPELIFDQGVGKLFVVRIAGNTYDRLALESIEYAVAHLGARLILVIGHDQCGAVGAALKAYPDPKPGPMIANIYPALRAVQDKPGDKLSNAIDANAFLTAQRLENEPALSSAVKAGTLKVLPARYSLGKGQVRILRSE